MTSTEIWAPIPGYEGAYEVSNKGRVRSLDRLVVDMGGKRERLFKGTIMRLQNDKDGYKFVHLHLHGVEKRNIKIHRLVAKCFIPNPKNLPYINHKDFDRTNNDVSNLEWCTPHYNWKFSKDAGRLRDVPYSASGKDNKRTKLLLMYDLDGNYIRSFYGAKEAAKFLGFKTYINIYMHLAGKRRNAYGHLWKVGNREDIGTHSNTMK